MRRILISAYGCEPDKGSEQGVGWHWMLEMAKTEELWVITRRNNQKFIERAFPHELSKHVHFIYYDLPQIFSWFKRKEKGFYLYYSLWQYGAYRYAKRLATKINFNYCQHLTFGNMWMPMLMHKLPIPFIWGPIGGGESVPYNLISTLHWKGRFTQYARYILIRFATMNPVFMGPTRAAKAILVRTEDSKKVIPKKFSHKVHLVSETGMSDEQLQLYKPGETDEFSADIQLICTGRLIALKNIAMAIRVFSLVRKIRRNIRLTIVGDGPLRTQLMEEAHKYDEFERIQFVSFETRDEVIDALQKSDIFFFPSLKEGGAWSLMEAMTVGLPVVCVDTSGMHTITNEDCAIRIPPTTQDEMTQRMVEAITLLVDSSELRKRMGENGRQRIRNNFTWSHVSVFMADLLNQLDRQPLN